MRLGLGEAEVRAAVQRWLPDIYRDPFSLCSGYTCIWETASSNCRLNDSQSSHKTKTLEFPQPRENSHEFPCHMFYANVTILFSRERGPYWFTLNMGEILWLSWTSKQECTHFCLAPWRCSLLEPSQHIWRRPHWHMGLQFYRNTHILNMWNIVNDIWVSTCKMLKWKQNRLCPGQVWSFEEKTSY